MAVMHLSGSQFFKFNYEENHLVLTFYVLIYLKAQHTLLTFNSLPFDTFMSPTL